MNNMNAKAILATVSMIVIVVLTLCFSSCESEHLAVESNLKNKFMANIAGVDMTFIRLDSQTCQIGTGFAPAVNESSSAITIPAEVEGLQVVRIGEHAFANCTDLSQVRCEIVDPIELPSNAFPQKVIDEVTLRIPRLTWQRYKGSDWNSFNSIVELPYYTQEGVELKIYVLDEEKRLFKVGDGNYPAISDTAINILTLPAEVNGFKLSMIERYAFKRKHLKGCVIPEGITHINESAFACSDIETISLPASLAIVDDNVFMDCKNLTNVTLREGLKSLGQMAFYNCAISEILLPNTLEQLGASCFEMCPLYSIIIPENSITNIPDMCFSFCTKLCFVSLPEGINSLGRLAFEGCFSLHDITLPASLKSIGKGCFQSIDLKTIHSRICEPFLLPAKNVFSENSYKAAMLLVPPTTTPKYHQMDIWNKFTKIIEAE